MAIDYFLKWVEAEAIISITEVKTFKFMWRNIICRYDLPHTLISDNGKQFKNKSLEAYSKRVRIKQFLSAQDRPLANGQIKVTNRMILVGIKKKLEDAKGMWTEDLYGVLWAYKTTERTLTGETSFMLSYGSEAVIPSELRLPSHRV